MIRYDYIILDMNIITHRRPLFSIYYIWFNLCFGPWVLGLRFRFGPLFEVYTTRRMCRH